MNASAANRRSRTGGTPSLLLLSLASSVSPFGMIVVVPTLAAIAERFGIAHGDAQFLIATYLFGLGVGQPVVGALSDQFGRRPVMLAGFLVYSLASLACAIAPDFATLVLARFVQALGVSVGTVCSRAIVRDTHDAIGAAQALAWIGAAMGVAPVLGPVIGGAIGAVAGPQAVFDASALLGLVIGAALFGYLPETRDRGAIVAAAHPWTTSYRQLLASRIFMGYTLMYAFVQGGFFAFLAVAAIVFEEHLGLGQQAFGAIWGAMALVYVAAAASAARLATRFGIRRSLLGASALAAVAGWLLVTVTLAGPLTIAGLLPPLAMLMAAAGVQTPFAITGAVNCRPEIAGTAAGLSSSLALVASGAFSIAAGLAYSGSFAPVALLMAISATLTLATCFMTRPA